MKANVIVFESITLALLLVFYHGSSRAMGRSRNRAYFTGAVLFSLVAQTLAVALGGMNFYWYSINSYYETYPLGGYIVWLGVVPFAACALFYMIAAISQMLSSLLMGKAKASSRAAVSGAIAVGFYALVLPVAVTNHWWTYNLKTWYVIDIPLAALLGIFTSAFLFNLVYELTIIETRDFKPLKKFEDKTVKKLLKSVKYARNLNWRDLQWLFMYRLVFAMLALGALMAPVVLVLWLVANRAHIPPGW